MNARGSPLRLVLAGAAALVLLGPAFAERASFYASNADWMEQTRAAIDADGDAKTVLAAIRQQAPGRVFAGLRSTGYGPQMNFAIPFNSVRFSDWLIWNGVSMVAAPYSSLSLNADLFWDFALDRREDYDLLNARYVVAPTATAMPAFLRPLVRTTRYTLYEAPTSGYAGYAAVIDRTSVRTQTSLFALNRPWFNGPDIAQMRVHRIDFPAATDATVNETVPACSRPTYSYERVQQARIDLLVGCPDAATLLLKVTYHPNWHVLVDGREAEPFMVSPSLVGVSLGPGEHFVTADYRSTPIKTPLAALGLLVALVTMAVPFAGRFGSLAVAYRGIASRARSRFASTGS